jgi:hypothetical protein
VVTANLMAPGLAHSGPLPCFCAMGVPKLSAGKGFIQSAEESGEGHIARPELELQVYDLGSRWRAEARGLPALDDSMLREVASKSHASKVLGAESKLVGLPESKPRRNCSLGRLGSLLAQTHIRPTLGASPLVLWASWRPLNG